MARNVAETDDERKVLRLWELGVAELGEYAHALGIEHQREQEQRDAVKKIRDRLTARLRRLRTQLEDGTEQ